MEGGQGGSTFLPTNRDISPIHQPISGQLPQPFFDGVQGQLSGMGTGRHNNAAHLQRARSAANSRPEIDCIRIVFMQRDSPS